ncbi:MAG: family 43 glycosylhydrolase [bacterium]
MTSAVSENLLSWRGLTAGVTRQNPLFQNLFESEAYQFTGFFGGKFPAMWAPDVWYCAARGKYLMYFCTSSTYKKSSICLASADKVTGPYTYEKTLLSSGFTRETLPLTNVEAVLGEEAALDRYFFADGDYNNDLWPNAIDPNTFHDASGRFWMVYGSWSGGIFLMEVDERTGDLIRPQPGPEVDAYFGRRLMGGGHRSMEGPYIIYDAPTGWYYLFVSFGWLAADGGYQIRLFRAKSPEGPYLDANGFRPGLFANHADFGVKLMGNHLFPSMEQPCLAPGHNSVLRRADGSLFLICHRRFKKGEDHHEPRVYPLYRTEDGWLTPSPFPYSGEERALKTLPEGPWQRLDHGRDISARVHAAQPADKPTEGVFLHTRDEAGNPVSCASQIRENRAIWYVHYEEEL